MFDLSNETGHVLLLGEGNFSFGASLLRKNESYDGSKLYATSYEDKTECLNKYRESQTVENIRFLSQNGAAVLHCIDATNISDTVSLNRPFDKIIFQFPHTGRKASIKQNRALLKKFFISCKPIITKHGSVIVTLCAGQGGTPSDVVLREYCNSWQIVEMASYAGFILTEVQPFESEEFPGYTSTGRRNRGNSFITQKAVSHRFEASCAPPPLDPEWVSCAQDAQVSAVTKRVKILEDEPDSLPTYWLSKEIAKRLTCVEQCLGFIGEVKFSEFMKEIKTVHGSHLPEEIFLSRTMEDIGKYSAQGTHQCLHGAVFQASNLRNISCGFQYYFLLTCSPENCIINLTEIQDILNDYSNVCLKLDDRKSDSNHGYGFMTNGHKDIYIDSNTGFAEVGHSCQIRVENGEPISILLLRMDQVVLAMNSGIVDTKWCWSLNSETRNNIINALRMNVTYKPKSLFASQFSHDFSFWMKDKETNDLPTSQDNLTAVVALIVDDMLVSMELLDEYTMSGKRSACYRVVYQSHDLALSKDSCRTLQLNVRNQLCRIFNIEMR